MSLQIIKGKYANYALYAIVGGYKLLVTKAGVSAGKSKEGKYRKLQLQIGFKFVPVTGSFEAEEFVKTFPGAAGFYFGEKDNGKKYGRALLTAKAIGSSDAVTFNKLLSDEARAEFMTGIASVFGPPADPEELAQWVFRTYAPVEQVEAAPVSVEWLTEESFTEQKAKAEAKQAEAAAFATAVQSVKAAEAAGEV